MEYEKAKGNKASNNPFHPWNHSSACPPQGNREQPMPGTSCPPRQPHARRVPLPTSERSSWDWGKLRKHAAGVILVLVFLRTKQLSSERTAAQVGDGAAEGREVAGTGELGWREQPRCHQHPLPSARKPLRLQGKGKSSLSL